MIQCRNDYIERNIRDIHITMHFDWKRFDLYWSDHSLPDEEITIHQWCHKDIDESWLIIRGKNARGYSDESYKHGEVIKNIIEIARYGREPSQYQYPSYPNEELKQYFEEYFEDDLQHLIGV